jgi:hypothetical protein
MSELIEEDVVGRCRRALVAMLGGIQPPLLAILRLVYSISFEMKEIARWI